MIQDKNSDATWNFRRRPSLLLASSDDCDQFLWTPKVMMIIVGVSS